jgi:hypothetical protein
MLTTAKVLNSSLDRLVCDDKSFLGAVIPRPFSGGKGQLAWIPVRRVGLVCPIESNEDLEEQFHWMFGPYILDDYVGELESMLFNVVHGSERSYICSTVRIEVFRVRGVMLQIQQIFIRPCLQGHRVLGKILLFLAKNAINEEISIAHCLPASATAIRKYYDGDNSHIFTQEVRKKDNAVTFTLKDRVEFEKRFSSLDSRPYPLNKDLNRDDMTSMDLEWARFARFVHEEKKDVQLIDYQFKNGYRDLKEHDFFSECEDLEISLTFDNYLHEEMILDPEEQDSETKIYYVRQRDLYQGVISFLQHLSSSMHVPRPALFHRQSMQGAFLRSIEPLMRNIILGCVLRYLHIDPRSRLERRDFENVRIHLASMKTILQGKKIDSVGNTRGLQSMSNSLYKDVPEDQKRLLLMLLQRQNPAWGCLVESFIKTRMFLEINADQPPPGITLTFTGGFSAKNIDSFITQIDPVIEAITPK